MCMHHKVVGRDPVLQRRELRQLGQQTGLFSCTLRESQAQKVGEGQSE